MLVYTTQVKNAFRVADWLVRKRIARTVHLRQPMRQNRASRVEFRTKFGILKGMNLFFSICVVCNKTSIHL